MREQKRKCSARERRQASASGKKVGSSWIGVDGGSWFGDRSPAPGAQDTTAADQRQGRNVKGSPAAGSQQPATFLNGSAASVFFVHKFGRHTSMSRSMSMTKTKSAALRNRDTQAQAPGPGLEWRERYAALGPPRDSPSSAVSQPIICVTGHLPCCL
ncbi:hypothetical protein N431DRAFT_451064 [Stipitochalara longipes BDJ]|nr:hypothetical protein N431DRAFT_451064 [Stipitochalara longipes BDJ]